MSKPYSYSKEKRHQRYLKEKTKPGYKEKRKEYSRQYYKANSDRINNRLRRWREANPEKVKEARKRRSLRDRVIKDPVERICAYCGEKYVVLPGSRSSKYCSYECIRNIGRDRARSRYYNHKEEIKAQATNWRKNNRERANLLSRLHKIRRKNAKSS